MNDTNPADNLATRKVTRLSRIRTKLNSNAAVIIQLLVFVMFIVLVTNLWIKTLDVNDRITQQDERINQQDVRIDKLSSVLDNNARILLHRDEVLADRIKELQSKERIGYQIACND